MALLVVPVVLLVGVATLIRLDTANLDDYGLALGINRLRHAHRELAPELEPEAREYEGAQVMIRVSQELYAQYQRGIFRLYDSTQVGFVPTLSVREAYSVNQPGGLGLRNIIGFALGLKMAGGQALDELAVCIFVVRKAQPELVDERYRIRTLMEAVPEFGSDLPSDVLEVGQVDAFVEYSRRTPGGAAVRQAGQPKSQFGTLGGWVINDSEEIHLLSCWHVLDAGTATLNPHPTIIKHENIDLGDFVASVPPPTTAPYAHGFPHFVPVPTVDAAVARLKRGAREADFILSVGEIRGTKAVNFGTPLPLSVRMYGAGSGFSAGTVMHYAVPGAIWLNFGGTPYAYCSQMSAVPLPARRQFAHPGDSGALVLTEDNHVVGMVVGGTMSPMSANPVAIISPIDMVLHQLKRATGKSWRFLTYP